MRVRYINEDLVNGHRITGDDEIKEIYLFKYPDDELGEEINDGVTLNLLWNALNDGEDIYDIIGVADSTIRERIFLMLSKCFNVKYSDIYDLWLDPIMAKNLYKSFTQGYLSADEYNDAISKLGIPEKHKAVKEDLDNPVGADTVKQLYLQEYPDDELGEEINDGVTLDLVWRGMNEGDDFYDIIGVSDSVVRERVFNMLSDYLGIDYDDIYYTWLDPDPDIRAKKREIRQAYHDKKITIGDYRKQMWGLMR